MVYRRGGAMVDGGWRSLTDKLAVGSRGERIRPGAWRTTLNRYNSVVGWRFDSTRYSPSRFTKAVCIRLVDGVGRPGVVRGSEWLRNQRVFSRGQSIEPIRSLKAATMKLPGRKRRSGRSSKEVEDPRGIDRAKKRLERESCAERKEEGFYR